MNITNRAFWCWLAGHEWRLFYPRAMPDSPVGDMTPIKVCKHCGKRKDG